MNLWLRRQKKASGYCTVLINAVSLQALIVPDKFQHILRVLNTNIDGKQKIMFGLTAIKVRAEFRATV